jgi:hypothetical protein
MQKRFLNKQIEGRERLIILPNGEKHRGQYILTELNDILASHNEENFSNTEGYPLNSKGQNINDRNYKDDKSAQNSVIKIAQNLEPLQIIAVNSSADGTPIIDKNGYVVSGNNRVMSVKLAKKKYPQNYIKYQDQLKEDIDMFKIDEESLNLLDNPILVRVDKDMPENLTTEDLAQFNTASTKGERPVDRAIKLSNILLENTVCKNIILSIIDGYDTFSDIYSNDAQSKSDRKKLVDNLIQCELISELQLPTYFDNGQFTEIGKDFVETILSAIILTPDALKVSNIEGVKKMRQIIISCLPIFVTNENLKEGSLKDYISEAVLIQYKVKAFLDFKDFALNQSLFPEELYDKKSYYLYFALNEGRNQFKKELKTYNQSVKANEGASLFDEEKLSIDDIFDRIFVKNTEPKDAKLIEMLFSNEQKKKLQNLINMNIDINNIEIEEKIVDDINDYKELSFEQRLSLICVDNWFNIHPEKTLGVPYEASGKYGTITKYKGTLDDIERIDAPLDFFGFDKSMDDPTISVNNLINLNAEALKINNQENILKAIENSESEILQLKNAKKTKRKKLIIKEFENTEEIKSFKEMYKELNPNISNEMLEAHIWYKSRIGQPLSGNYVSILYPERIAEQDARKPYNFVLSLSEINYLVKTGNLFYYRDSLVPLYEYTSGNLYDKNIDLNAQKEYIIKTYGQETFDRQSNILKDTLAKLIKLKIQSENGLVIKPTSDFARDFKIKRLKSNEDDDWQMALTKDGSFDEKNYEKGNKTEIIETSLFNAFAWYLIVKTPPLKKNVSHNAIVHYYLFKANFGKNVPDKEKKAIKEYTKIEGDRLFLQFIQEELLREDILRLETTWNLSFNNYVPINFDLLPLSFSIAKYVNGFEEVIRSEKRDAIAHAMSNGTSILAYDVGVGKTPSAIFTISTFIEAGYCKKPFVCVPNQVYKQFISEIKMFTPQYKINELYNLSQEYIDAIRDESLKIDDYSISVMTYEGFANIGFNDNTRDIIFNNLFEILSQGLGGKELVKFRFDLEELMGRANRGTKLTIEELGFDFACFDEAHSMKKVFTRVQSPKKYDEKGNEIKEKKRYNLSSGSPSAKGLRGFMIMQYILEKNNNKNVILLTATPFTNSPLEIFSMLSMVAYQRLKNSDINNIQIFFDTFVEISLSLAVNSRLKVEMKEVVLGFNNLIALQSLIRRYVLYKTGDQTIPPVPRPKKYVLPYLEESVNGTTIKLPQDKRIETYISMTDYQEMLMDDIIKYSEGTISEKILEGKYKTYNKVDDSNFDENLENKSEEDSSKIFTIKLNDDEESGEIKSGKGEIIDITALSLEEQIGVRTLKGISMSRNLASSPYLYRYSGLENPTYIDYIETSPKLIYVMECIKSVRNYHLVKNEPISGQVIYMDRGIEYFPLIKEYLVKVIGYNEKEVGIIKSGLPKVGINSKENIKNLFNGEIYNETTKDFEKVSDAERLKIVIGSSTIKEGLNLQKYGTVLYNCSVDWNPTDMKQLEGRIYRQKNTFNAVRIVIPLLINSADIFLFQKLQEKSSRLHSIWSTNNLTNKIDVGDLNIEDVKYALIRNPEKIAELKIKEEVEKVTEDFLLVSRKVQDSYRLYTAIYKIKYYLKDVTEHLEKYKKFNFSNDLISNVKKLVNAIPEIKKKPRIDNEGNLIYSPFAYSTYLTQNQKDLIESGKIKKSSITEDPYYEDYDDRELKKYYKEYYTLIKIFKNEIPNLQIETDEYRNQIKLYTDKLDHDLDLIKKKIAYLNSAEYLGIKTDEIIDLRKNNNLLFKPISELVAGFSSFNYLLSDKKVKEGKKVDITPVEVVETIIKQPIVQNIEPEIVVPSINTENLIKALEISLKFADSNSKLIIEKQIKALKISLKYGN